MPAVAEGKERGDIRPPEEGGRLDDILKIEHLVGAEKIEEVRDCRNVDVIDDQEGTGVQVRIEVVYSSSGNG